MEEHQIIVRFMSGREDGSSRRLYAHGGDGIVEDGRWIIQIGRQNDCDIAIEADDYVSRRHARLYHTNSGWWLQDIGSSNGTFTTPPDDFFRDEPLNKIHPVPLEIGQLFRVGRTWLCLELFR